MPNPVIYPADKMLKCQSWNFNINFYRPVHLGPNDPRRKSNSLRKVMGSFSISKLSCFIEKKSSVKFQG